MCGKNCNCLRLCPISLGLAIGITAALAVLFGALIAMYYGVVPPWQDVSIYAFWILVKGFIAGFFIALFYDLFAWLIAKCCKCCRKKADGKCSCGASCKCSTSCAPTEDKTETGK